MLKKVETMPKYKFGKKLELMEPKTFRNHVQKAKLPLEKESFIWLLFHSGSRKSESYELTAEQLKVTPEFLIIDYKQRKKHSAQIPPLKFSRDIPGVETIVRQYQKALQYEPQRKTIYFQEETSEPLMKDGKPLVRKKGSARMKKHTAHKRVKAQWLFPNIGKQTAWRIVKAVLGKEYYPHYLRLNCLTEIAEDPTANLTRLKSHSGIKTMRVLEAYLGVSEKEQDAAREFRERKWRIGS